MMLTCISLWLRILCNDRKKCSEFSRWHFDHIACKPKYCDKHTIFYAYIRWHVTFQIIYPCFFSELQVTGSAKLETRLLSRTQLMYFRSCVTKPKVRRTAQNMLNLKRFGIWLYCQFTFSVISKRFLAIVLIFNHHYVFFIQMFLK